MDPVQEMLDALRKGDEKRAREILAAHPGVVNARAPGEMPLLQMAIYARASRLVEALLEAGAQPTVHEAAALGDVTRLRALVALDPSLRDAPGVDGARPLHLAAHFGREDAARLLLNLGADVDAYAGAPFSNAPLHAACAGGQKEMVAMLLRAGAKADLPDGNGFTPLHVAAANGLVEVVGLLLAKGATREARANDGRTPLDLADEREEDEVAKLLRTGSTSK